MNDEKPAITQRLSLTPEEREALAKRYPHLIPPPKDEVVVPKETMQRLTAPRITGGVFVAKPTRRKR